MQLAPAYLNPLAKQLDGYFGESLPFDLTLMFEDGSIAGLPAAPDRAGVAAWAAWLRQCPDGDAGRVLKGIDDLVGGASAAVASARAQLVLAGILQSNNIADRLVVNRKKLLSHVQAMLAERWRILRVQGGRGEGKTFTRSILRVMHGHGMGGMHRLVEIDVPSYLGLEALARGLCEGMGGKDVKLPSREDTTLDKWVELLAQRVVRDAADLSGPTWWLVLDDCSRVAADDVTMFLRRLAEEVEASKDHPRAPRLVLLDVPESITQRRGEVLLQEPLTPISRQDVEQFFADLAAKHATLPKEKFPEWVGRVLEEMAKGAAPPAREPAPVMRAVPVPPGQVAGAEPQMPAAGAPPGQVAGAEPQMPAAGAPPVQVAGAAAVDASAGDAAEPAGAAAAGVPPPIYPLIYMHRAIEKILRSEGGIGG